MKKKLSILSVCCVTVLFVFTVFMVWYLPSMSSVHDLITETQERLETSRGRENRQQAEYDKAVAELPLIRQQILDIKPLVAEAKEKLTVLKARRKELRAEKQELEKKLSELSVQEEDNNHEEE